MTPQSIHAQLVADGRISDPSSARARLLREAARLFREKGFERTTVRDLAAAIGIQSGSLFHHFRSKEEILKAVMVETILLNTELLQDAASKATSDAGCLRALVRSELESINGQTGEAMTVLIFEWRSLSEPSQQEILHLRKIYEQIWLDALNQLKDNGQLTADPFVTRRMLTGALSWTVTWYQPGGSMTIDDMAGEVMGMLGL